MTCAFSALKEGGRLVLTISASNDIQSVAKLNGFINISVEGNTITASKAVFSSTGPSKIIKKKKEQNPWANLDNNAEIINEDELMSEATSVAKKFCGDDSKMQAAKPCANCTCGLKE